MSTAIVCMLNNTALKESAMAELQELSLGELKALSNESSSLNYNPLTNSTTDQIHSEPLDPNAHCYFQEAVSKKIDTVSLTFVIIQLKNFNLTKEIYF